MIRLENLEVSINKSEIIKGVSFHVNKGDFVGAYRAKWKRKINPIKNYI